MPDQFNLKDIYEQNLNFFIGAGASHGFLPTLALEIKDDDGNKHTFETLAKIFENHSAMKCLLFMLYYRECIKPGLPYVLQKGVPAPPRVPVKEAVISEYKNFINTLVRVLDRQKDSAKKANVFTTNYDNCIETACEELLTKRISPFYVNDGSSGFQKRIFHTKNFNNRVINKGAFGRYEQTIPQINVLHAHGSVHWEKGHRDGEIELNYGTSNYNITFDGNEEKLIEQFKTILHDANKTNSDIEKFYSSENLTLLKADSFWKKYNEMPIVNPTKWKFHETVFEEAYYQILRHLSYELERENTVLVTFGFSFADEHILTLVQRSLSNPSLTIYISCFNESELIWMRDKFNGYQNVKFIYSENGLLNFSKFNSSIFTLFPQKEEHDNNVVTLPNETEAVLGGEQ
ncbi:TPA: SIR2 family protein [Aeromonas salmonicida]|nr:SIR2 family protein [Aeromonas salmonicida]